MTIIVEAPPQAVKHLGMETWIAVAGGPLWGGCQLWTSTDNANFHYADTLNGGSAMGVTTAIFASGSDPDTANTCSVDLTESRGQLLPGSSSDADNARTLCYVCNTDGSNGEYFSYEQATLTAQYKYDLGVHSPNAGYLRRGLFGSAIASHPSGSLFVRLRPSSYLTMPYVASDIGKTIYFKLLAFNIYGGGQQTLDQVSSGSYTLAGPPTGAASSTPLSTFHGGSVLAQTGDIDNGATSATVFATTSGAGTSLGANYYYDIVDVTITTLGGPVSIDVGISFLNAGAAGTVLFALTRDGTFYFGGGGSLIFSADSDIDAAKNGLISLPIIDAPAAGTHAYHMVINWPNPSATNSYAVITATELRR